MTRDIFNSWLKTLNRKILLLLDNCSAQPDVELSNIKLVFLPPRTTSHLQPQDAGIIQAVKLVYRQKLLRHLLLRMDDSNTASDLVKYVNHAWDVLKDSTINKCFTKLGVQTDVEAETSVTEVQTAELDHMVEPGVSFDNFISFDDQVATTDACDDDDWEDALMARARGNEKSSDDVDEVEDDDDDEDTQPSASVLKISEISDILTDSIDFAMFHANSKLLHYLSKAMNELGEMKHNKRTTQQTIGHFFKATDLDGIAHER